jgi:carboxymethylenebutenolidase
MVLGKQFTLTSTDNFKLGAYRADPTGAKKGGIVVIQEIFGVNAHIRAVTDSFAAEGYTAIAPSLFDRVRRGIEIGYSADEMQEGFGYVQQLKTEQTLQDVAAAAAVVKHSGRVGMVGYCWGGRVTYLCASELPLACGVV